MTSFFKGIGYLVGDILMAPMNGLAKLELTNWWLANGITWLFIIICCSAFYYWIGELRRHEKSGEDVQDTTAHSFLK
ncbi:MAG: uracil phosphoribosyltransferase [Flavobacterium sp.]|nr:uracil phosphoribosyltransferase [Candidatus Neoflavobacterium equi]